MQLKSLLQRHHQELALLIGNGINRYNSRANNNSWDGLLTSLARTHLSDFSGKLPIGISLTEFYDVLDLGLRAEAQVAQASATQTPQLATTVLSADV